ncbi:MAG: hypothetical protein ABIB97_04180 [Patescibacteria group bacterium]
MLLDSDTITPICWAYFALALPMIILALFLIFSDPLGYIGAVGLVLVPSVTVIVCQFIGANIVAMFMPTVSAIELVGGKDFLLYPGMAFRNAGFVMIPFLIYSLLALMRAKIQWESFKSTRVPSTSRL